MSVAKIETQNYELPATTTKCQFVYRVLEMLKMFAILIHDDESDYSVNGLVIKKMRFPSR